MPSDLPSAHSERVPCETIDCQNRAEVYLTCEGEGAYPYCGNCASVLRVAGGEEERGSVRDPVVAQRNRYREALEMIAVFNTRDSSATGLPSLEAKIAKEALDA